VEGLWPCGASCHPDPGVPFLPGYGCARQVAAARGAAPEAGARPAPCLTPKAARAANGSARA